MDKKFLGIVLLLAVVGATKFSLNLHSYEKQCFYEILRIGLAK